MIEYPSLFSTAWFVVFIEDNDDDDNSSSGSNENFPMEEVSVFIIRRERMGGERP